MIVYPPRCPANRGRRTSVVIEQNDEWLVGHRYLSNHSLEAILDDYKKDNNRKEVRELTTA
jgi:hypothetical protein